MCEQSDLNKKHITPVNSTSRRHKLWELPPTFLCSVIGTCLTLNDIHKILNSCQINFDKRLSTYDVHNAFVAMTNKCSKATRQAQKLMDSRYATEIRQLSKARSDDSLSALWDKGFDEGRIAGIYWALVTHPLISPELKMRAYGEVHMLSHQIGENNRDEIKNNSTLEQRVIELHSQLNNAQKQNKQVIDKQDNVIKKLKLMLSLTKESEHKLKLAEKKISQLESGKNIKNLHVRINELEQHYTQSHYSETRAIKKRDNLFQQLKASQNSYIELKKKFHHQSIEIRQLQQPLTVQKELINTVTNESNQSDINLCGRCVLFVGGRTGQCSHFRKLVESKNGRFIHHDGGREDCSQRLGSILPQADVVLCPIDCVSHDAVYRIKRFCSEHAKQLVFMPRASLSAFSHSLKQVAN